MSRRRDINADRDNRAQEMQHTIRQLEAERNGLNQRIAALKRELARMECVTVTPPVRRTPGHCLVCGKHIGRGLHFHEKACRG